MKHKHSENCNTRHNHIIHTIIFIQSLILLLAMYQPQKFTFVILRLVGNRTKTHKLHLHSKVGVGVGCHHKKLSDL
jgi:hypothetical protein